MCVAHNDLNAFAAKLEAARQEAAEFNSTYILDIGVDAEVWALNDIVDLGGSLETYQRQEPGLGQQMQPNQVPSNPGGRDAPSLSETMPTGWTPIVTS